MPRCAKLLMIVCLCMLSLGCVERRLMITSEPAGALVYLNDQEVGRTPLEVPFTWYGTYDVRLEREGYTTLQTEQLAERPWWEAPGPDLFAEAIPNKSVEIAWHLKMQPAVPASEVDPQRVLEFADQLRELNRRD
ncbi:MAG: PEGA domain-containing protein [Phycisphaeraceae bacterium]